MYWLLCDGGEPNRSLIKMCVDNQEENNFVAYNIKTGGPLVLMVDCKVSELVFVFPLVQCKLYQILLSVLFSWYYLLFKLALFAIEILPHFQKFNVCESGLLAAKVP